MNRKRKKLVEKNRKKKLIEILLVSIIASLFSVLFGVILGLVFTDFYSWHLLYRMLVWLTNIVISYSLAYFSTFIFKFNLNFFDFKGVVFTATFSVILVFIISGEFDSDYVLTFTTLIGFVEAIKGLKNSFIKLNTL